MSDLPIPDPIPDLASIIEAAIVKRTAKIRVALPARVEKYDPVKQSVTVQALVMEGYYSEAEGRKAERIPAIPGVPVEFQGSGDFSITFPIKPGDTGLLVFCSSSIDKFKALGSEVDPGTDHRHQLADAVFIPGLRSFARPIGSGSGGGVNGAPNGGDAMILKGGKIRIGDKDADDPVVRKSDLDAVIDAIDTRLVNHVHPAGSPNTGNGVVASGTISKPACSAVVKVK